MGGWLNTSCIVVSIRAIASVRYREVVRSWEGPLWEVPLYLRDGNPDTEFPSTASSSNHNVLVSVETGKFLSYYIY